MSGRDLRDIAEQTERAWASRVRLPFPCLMHHEHFQKGARTLQASTPCMHAFFAAAWAKCSV
jgi:hypothetical protein